MLLWIYNKLLFIFWSVSSWEFGHMGKAPPIDISLYDLFFYLGSS